ncbi:hypothetical protein JCM11251_002287 [Rhodosporidiobolus azoricus]
MSALASDRSIQDLLAEALSHLPSGGNPYTFLRLPLVQTLAPKPLSPLRPLLYTASALACMIPGYTALCFATWTLACAYVIHVKAFASRSTWPWFFSAYLLNTLGILIPSIHVVVVVILVVFTSKHFHQGLDQFVVVDTLLRQLESQWNGEEFDPRSLEGILPNGSSGLGIGALLVFVAIAYIRTLRRQSMTTSATTTVQSARRNDFSETRWWLTAVTCAFALVFTALVSNFLWVAALGDKPYVDAKVSLIANVLPFYVLTVACIPVSFILLVRAVNDPAHQHRSASRSSRSRSRSRSHKYDHELSTSTPDAPLHHILALPHWAGRSASPQGMHPFPRPGTGKSDAEEKHVGIAQQYTSGAFDNLQLQVALGSDIPSFVKQLDAEVSSIGKDGSCEEGEGGGGGVEYLDSLAAHADPQTALKKVSTRGSSSEVGGFNSSSKKKKRSQGGKGNGLEGVQVRREAVTVVSMAEEVEETQYEAELRRARELYERAPW